MGLEYDESVDVVEGDCPISGQGCANGAKVGGGFRIAGAPSTELPASRDSRNSGGAGLLAVDQREDAS